MKLSIDGSHIETFNISSFASICSPQSASINVFDDVVKRLEILKCTEVRTRAISYGMIFTGLYRDVGFEFNVYVNAQGHLNRKTRQSHVWHKPVTPPDRLKDAIDEVIQCGKRLMD